MDVHHILFLAALGANVLLIQKISPQTATKQKVGKSHETLLSIVLLAVLPAAVHLLPIVAVTTGLLRFADFALPGWVSIVGLAILVAALLLFWRARTELGDSWSTSLEILEGHRLVTTGIYGRLRHPCFAAWLLWAIAQAMILQNWFAGFSALAFFVPLSIYQIPREERMLTSHFGMRHEEYKESTGMLLPRLVTRRSRQTNPEEHIAKSLGVAEFFLLGLLARKNDKP